MTTKDQAKARARAFSVYLGLGSNLGDREANLSGAIERIKGLGVEIVRASSIYETEPVGYADQPWFLNQVVEIRIAAHTTTPVNQLEELLGSLHEIEHEMGRERTIPNGPRVIDIDILLAPGMRSVEENSDGKVRRAALIVPHPRMHERRFVLEPLCEIAPDLIHPALGQTCREMLAALGDRSTIRLYKRGKHIEH